MGKIFLSCIKQYLMSIPLTTLLFYRKITCNNIFYTTLNIHTTRDIKGRNNKYPTTSLSNHSNDKNNITTCKEKEKCIQLAIRFTINHKNTKRAQLLSFTMVAVRPSMGRFSPTHQLFASTFL